MLYDGANKRNATSPRTINGASKVDALCADLETLSVERFEILSLNVRLHLIKRTMIAQGGGWACAVTPREVMRQALADDAACLILIHNHPSGDSTPSAEDVELTRAMVAAAKTMGIRILDHAIIASGGAYHFAEHAAHAAILR